MFGFCFEVVRLSNYCKWVEFDYAGNEKKCPFSEKVDSEKIEDCLHFCRFCLEGQKVDALNFIIEYIEKIANNNR